MKSRQKEAEIFLAANKKDLGEARQVSAEEGRKIAEENGIHYMEVSAKTGENVPNLFDSIVEFLVAKHKQIEASLKSAELQRIFENNKLHIRK